MIHHSIGASRRISRTVGALSASLLAVIAGSLPNPASAGGAIGLDPQPPLRGSYCEGSDQDLAPPTRAGCARISGYITAGARFGADGGLGARPAPCAPIEEPAIAGNQASGLTIVGAPLSDDRFLAPANSGDIAR